MSLRLLIDRLRPPTGIPSPVLTFDCAVSYILGLTLRNQEALSLDSTNGWLCVSVTPTISPGWVLCYCFWEIHTGKVIQRNWAINYRAFLRNLVQSGAVMTVYDESS